MNSGSPHLSIELHRLTGTSGDSIGERDSLLPANSLANVLSQRLDERWMLPSTRQKAMLALEHLHNVDWDVKALLSTEHLPHVIRLHQLGVIDLCSIDHPVNAQNAIEHLTDATPDLPLAEQWGWQIDLAGCLKELTKAGVSINGHRQSQQPPLAHALNRADAETWVKHLLDAGADPLQRVLAPSQGLAAAPGAARKSCLAIAAERGQSKSIDLMIAALLPEGEVLAEGRCRTLLKAAIEADCVELFQRLKAGHDALFPGLVARALHEGGRQIGPRLSAHLVGVYVRNHAIADPHESTLSENRAILAGLSRVFETDDAMRVRAIRQRLREVIQQHNESGNRLFNTLLQAAIKRTCLKAAKALLGETPDANLRHGIRIEEPAKLLKTIGTLAAPQRAEILPTVCRHILEAPNSETTVRSLRENIDDLLPGSLGHNPSRVAVELGSLSGVFFASTAGLGYWLANSTARLVEAEQRYGDSTNLYTAVSLQSAKFMFGSALSLTALTGTAALLSSGVSIQYLLIQRNARAYREELLQSLNPTDAQV